MTAGGSSGSGSGKPLCIADAGNLFDGIVASQYDELAQRNCFRQSGLSADGTSILTYNADLKLRTFVLPPDLLSDNDNLPKKLTPYTTSSERRSNAFAPYSLFDLSDASTTLVLQSRQDLPIQLVNALDLDYTHASYPWIKSTTEEYISPNTLVWTADGAQFVAGAKERIAVFDTNCDGRPPIVDLRSRISRSERRTHGTSDVELSGLVSSLAISNATGMLAAGTTQRQIALYDTHGLGRTISAWHLHEFPDSMGTGIMQLEWDGSGRYLLVAERQSDEIIIFDVRIGRVLGRLIGRKGKTTLRLTFSVVCDAQREALDVWAGGTDGAIRVWRDVLSRQGSLLPDEEFAAHHDAVTAVLIHPSASVAVTTSGLRDSGDEHAGLGVSMRVWSL